MNVLHETATPANAPESHEMYQRGYAAGRNNANAQTELIVACHKDPAKLAQLVRESIGGFDLYAREAFLAELDDICAPYRD